MTASSVLEERGPGGFPAPVMAAAARPARCRIRPDSLAVEQGGHPFGILKGAGTGGEVPAAGRLQHDGGRGGHNKRATPASEPVASAALRPGTDFAHRPA